MRVFLCEQIKASNHKDFLHVKAILGYTSHLLRLDYNFNKTIIPIEFYFDIQEYLSLNILKCIILLFMCWEMIMNNFIYYV